MGEDAEARLEEGQGLARAIGIEVVDAFIVPIRAVRPGTLFGEGQVERLAVSATQNEAELVIIDGALSAIQQRNLEDKLKRKVIDRTGLILEIFGERAATAEWRLQVELAHLDYQAGRLVRSWTHLERQRGGFGFLGGPGETQIEADRRMIRNRMGRLRRELEQVRRTRGLHRERRQRAPWPVIALVGYTNAGKSTLFNRLTGAAVMAEDLLFATLDPTLRRMKLPHGRTVILSDTVGFISDLPTHLVAAFRATLEEVLEADIILHVRDMSDPDNPAQAADVMRILSDLGIGEKECQERMIEVWNKIDRLEDEAQEALLQKARTMPNAAALSAVTGEGVGELLDEIAERLSGVMTEATVILTAEKLGILPWLYEHAIVDAREDLEDGSVSLDVRLSESQALELERRLGNGPKPPPRDW